MRNTRPYNVDLRKRVVLAVDKGLKRKTIAKRFEVGIATVNRWHRVYKETGSIEPKKDWRKGHSHAIKNLDEFSKFVEKNRYLTQKEMAEEWKSVTGNSITKTTIGSYLDKIGFTKKRIFTIQRAG